jgi:MFS transporter, SP family, general alpha glucoside:H+ symporter
LSLLRHTSLISPKALPPISAMDLKEVRLPSVACAATTGARRDSTTDEVYSNLSAAVPDLAQLTSDAKAATQAEHTMTILEGLRLYPKAVGWSILLSLAIVMEGYDTILLGQFFALPEFKKHYGEPARDGDYEVSTAWQSGLTNGAQVGEILGLFLNGIIAEKYGYRICMMCSLVAMVCFIFLAFFAVNVKMLEAAEILCGIPWGVFQTLTTTYAAEVMPVALRAYLTTYVNLCWITGQLIGSGILRGFINNSTQWSYRIPFAIQWFWALPLLIGIYFAPESPWWLVRHGRLEETRRSLLRLTSKGNVHFNIDETIAMMRHTHEVEKSMSRGDSYLDCFKGVELRRTEIACMSWIIQVFCGSPLFIYSAYFFVQAGLPTNKAFDVTIGQYALGFIATVSAWGMIGVCGRRTLYLWGQVGMLILLVVIGCLGTQPLTSSISWATASLLLVFTFIYDLTVGPVCYSLVPEIPSTRLRVKTVVLARVAYNIAFLIANILMPKMLNPTAWNWKGKTGFLWAGTSFLCIVWTYFRLPEPKGLTYCELDILFEHRAEARKFRRFQVILEASGYFCVTSSEEDGGRHASTDFIG